jgi:hypothetical protein
MTQYNSFFENKTINELAELLFNHKINRVIITQDYYDALLTHLAQRDLSPAERSLIDDVLKGTSEELKTKESEFKARLYEPS